MKPLDLWSGPCSMGVLAIYVFSPPLFKVHVSGVIVTATNIFKSWSLILSLIMLATTTLPGPDKCRAVISLIWH